MPDPRQLKRMAAQAGPIQIVHAGRAYPGDEEDKECIQQIFQARGKLLPEINMVCLENCKWGLGRLLVAGTDVWLNTPQPPLEACGMKAALNGVPSFSVLDGLAS